MVARVQTVAVDFDGVIHQYGRGWQDGTIYDAPMPGAVDGLKRLQQRYAVFVFTSREVEQVLPWLEDLGFDVAADGPPYPTFWNSQEQILVTNRKLPAVAYLDDRAVRFADWDSVDAQLEEVRSDASPPRRFTVSRLNLCGAVGKAPNGDRLVCDQVAGHDGEHCAGSMDNMWWRDGEIASV
jgi:hypothetical protein